MNVTAIPVFEHPSAVTLVRVAIAFAFLAVGATCGVWSTLVHWEIMEKVNARLPTSEQFQPLWCGPFKRARLDEEYRRLFPDGKDLKLIYRLGAVMFVAFLGFLIALRSLF
jgi:hypothetical protein